MTVVSGRRLLGVVRVAVARVAAVCVGVGVGVGVTVVVCLFYNIYDVP